MNEPVDMQNSKPDRRGLLRRLRSDTAGNTLMLVAAAILPLTAMIGAGVDLSRTYMIKSRLQQACDAGALAARKSMGGSATLTTAATTNSQTFFANNFPAGAFGTTNISFTPALDANAQVTATANARVPETIMTVFGNNYTDLTVRCDAILEVANTDVMLVLDVTGSMLDCPDDSACGGGGGSKIVGLRAAVLDFYDTINGSATATSQVRFGFVPYSANVNVGELLPTAYLNDSHTYQSAVANMTTPKYLGTPGNPVVTVETYSTTLSSANCNKYGVNKNYPTLNGSTFNTGGPAPAMTTKTVYSFKNWGVAPGTTSGTNRTCRRNKTVTDTTYTLLGYSLTNWTFQPSSYNVSNFKAGTNITIATSNPTGYVPTSGQYNQQQLAAVATAGTTNSSYAWNKCIEERDTVAQATFAPIPAAAYDLNIDLIPSSTETRWRPSFQQVIRNRPGPATVTSANLTTYSNPSHSCPRAAAKLAEMTRSQVEAYVNSLAPTGNTYHDIGMAWGARLISPTGLFAAENVVAANGREINRHVIFMTDGLMCPNPGVYTPQGVENIDRRVMGATAPTNCSGEIITRHTNRFLALCQATKGMNISLWTVAFGTSNPPSLVSCANAGQSFVATNTATLRAQFQLIASRIASLRLSR